MSATAGRPPSVDALARSLRASGLPEPLLVEIARDAIATGRTGDVDLLVTQRKRRLLTSVINGTGVLLHTNLGRAPIGVSTGASYSNLEFDLASGKRGSRHGAVGDLIATATGAQAALVVNNCAGAVLLVLAALAGGGGRVAISRGELVEIGGGFRIPDVMAQSGATMVEVGTTNRTRLADFERAQADGALAVALHVHRSNYRIEGFTESVSITQLASLDTTVVADIGSGLLDAACPWLTTAPPSWLNGEPAARQSLAAGADLVLFSGDKLLGGPQSGIIAGDASLVAACAAHPLARALRPGGLVLSALQTVLLAYLHRNGEALPFWRMATTPVTALTQRAQSVAEQVLARAPSLRLTVVETEAVPGGGTLPGVTIPSAGLSVRGDHTEALRARERPIIARVAGPHTVIDFRTIDPLDDAEVVEALVG
ncbi:MAG: L-seryl-tRNA(Sec) selenium transferase [Actinomycetota bacterium]|nr:L-seryl-tRNA(Sec) selenium transferase [Actinomycetota bacterium]